MFKKANSMNLIHGHFPSSPGTPTLNNSKRSVASKNSGSPGLPQRQRHLSTDSSKAELAQMTDGSTSSLDSHAAKDKHEDEAPEGCSKGQKLVEEEVSETGRVRNLLLVTMPVTMCLFQTVVMPW